MAEERVVEFPVHFEGGLVDEGDEELKDHLDGRVLLAGFSVVLVEALRHNDARLHGPENTCDLY